MTTAHAPSDNAAIAAAHDRRPEIASARLRKVCEELIANPSSPWVLEQVKLAASAVHHQGIADLRAAVGALEAAPAGDVGSGKGETPDSGDRRSTGTGDALCSRMKATRIPCLGHCAVGECNRLTIARLLTPHCLDRRSAGTGDGLASDCYVVGIGGGHECRRGTCHRPFSCPRGARLCVDSFNPPSLANITATELEQMAESPARPEAARTVADGVELARQLASKGSVEVKLKPPRLDLRGERAMLPWPKT